MRSTYGEGKFLPGPKGSVFFFEFVLPFILRELYCGEDLKKGPKISFPHLWRHEGERG